jgi:TRAP-type C4-dicarboxylate transport system permease small subunit
MGYGGVVRAVHGRIYFREGRIRMFRRIMNAFDRILEKGTGALVILGGIMTLIMMFVTCYGVTLRYFFRRPEPVSYEIATICMLWAFLFGISFVEWRGTHIRADIFTPFMPKPMVRFLHTVLSHFLALTYCVILTWKGFTVALYSYSIGERSMSVWAEPLFPIKIMVPIGYFFLCLVVLRNLCHGIASYTTKTGVDAMGGVTPPGDGEADVLRGDRTGIIEIRISVEDNVDATLGDLYPCPPRGSS